MSENTGAASSYEKKREKVKAELEQRQVAEKNALSWVMKLLENKITEQQLLEAASQLSPQHYRDVTEERGLALLCGYPICANKLKSLNHKQKYHISARANKVYDVSERKYFCSASCYKASKFLEAQLSEEPLWARGVVSSSNIELLPLNAESSKSDVKDESVVIDSNSVYLDPDKPLTEILAEEILHKLTLEEADVNEDAIPDAASLEVGDSSDEEDNQPIQKLLSRRKEQRLAPAPDSSAATRLEQPISEEDKWVGSMLTRLNTSQGQSDVQTTTGDKEQPNVTHDMVETSTKNHSIGIADSKKADVGTAAKERQAATSKKTPVKADMKFVRKPKATASKVVLLDVTMPVPAGEISRADTRQLSNQTAALQACLDRLTDWFTDDSRQHLFTSVDEVSNLDSQSQPSTSSTSCEDADRESVTAPNIETVVIKQKAIVYQRLLRSYERRSTAMPGAEGFRDKLTPLTKTFRLTKDNISAKPLEWSMISLALGACVHQQNEEVLNSIIAELVRVANDRNAGKTLNTFIEYHKHLLPS